MKKTTYILILGISLLVSTTTSAQILKSAYFMDGYTYNYKLNPAFRSNRGYVSFPALGHLNVGVESNLGLSTFLYPTADGQLTTFLNSSVTPETVASSVIDNNRMTVNVSTPVISTGWWKGKTFHNIDLSVRADIDLSLPGDMFRFLKGMPSGDASNPEVYNLGRLGVAANGYFELGYGFSTDFAEWAHFGMRFKFLLGAVYGKAYTDKFLITKRSDEWSIDSKVNLMVSEMIDMDIRDGQPVFAYAEKIRPNYGAAVDLGLSFDFLEYFTVSASLLDLGFMSTPRCTVISTSGEPWTYTGIEGDIDVNESGVFEEQMNVILNEVEGIVKFTDRQIMQNKFNLLAMTANAGLEFRMPFYDRLSLGILSSTRIIGPQTWSEGRFSLNVAPVRCFSLSANYGISHFGSSAGAALSLHCKGFNLFLGTDSYIPFFHLNPQGIPVRTLNTRVSFGLNFLFGKYHGRLFD